MNDSGFSVEIAASTVEEAIAQGAQELGVPQGELEIEVLDEGARGVLGIGSRQARVRLTRRSEAPDRQAARPPAEHAEAPAPEGEQDAVRIAGDTVRELLQRMGIEARVEARWGQADAPDRIRPLYVDVHGDDLSILIGRRGETLSALQYITRLIVGKELKRPVAVLIDVEGYRARRERQLRQLARRMASQALETNRTMSLEPMPAFERRIIHLELRDNPDVDTLSVGEGNRRKVTIIPRR